MACRDLMVSSVPSYAKGTSPVAWMSANQGVGTIVPGTPQKNMSYLMPPCTFWIVLALVWFVDSVVKGNVECWVFRMSRGRRTITRVFENLIFFFAVRLYAF